MSRLAGTLFRNRRTAIELLIGLRRALQKETGTAKKTTKLRPWTPTEIYKLKGLAKKKVGVEKIARALNRTAIATAAKARMLGVSVDMQE
jgi:hypothetical protein